MDKDQIAQFESYVFETLNSKIMAADFFADFIGVLIDVKPAMAWFYRKKYYPKLETWEFQRMIKGLGLSVLPGRRRLPMSKWPWAYERLFFISKDMETAEKLKAGFKRLHGSKGSKEAMEKATYEIGMLLGYPETAVKNFVTETDYNNKERVERMKRNRYYAHSPEHEEEEYQAYDRKINEAIEEYAPKTKSVLTAEVGKRWL